VHDLKAGKRSPVPIDAAAITAAEESLNSAAQRLKARDFTRSPGPACRKCEVRTVCSAARQ
jgi:CRISPR/Cas system-associated exonuclease Cas4 (RecB family)